MQLNIFNFRLFLICVVLVIGSISNFYLFFRVTYLKNHWQETQAKVLTLEVSEKHYFYGTYQYEVGQHKYIGYRLLEDIMKYKQPKDQGIRDCIMVDSLITIYYSPDEPQYAVGLLSEETVVFPRSLFTTIIVAWLFWGGFNFRVKFIERM